MRTVETERTILGLSPFKILTTIRPLEYKKHAVAPTTVPAGTSVQVYWSRKDPSRVFFDYDNHLRATKTYKMKKTFSGAKFTGVPSIRTLEKWMEDGYSKTITGYKTEPDGYGPDGSPSWNLILGYI